MANDTRRPVLLCTITLIVLLATTAQLVSAKEYNVKACYYPLDSDCPAANETCESIKPSGSCFIGPDSLLFISSFELNCTNNGDNFTALAYQSPDCSGTSLIDFAGATDICTTRPALVTYNIQCIEVTPTPTPTPQTDFSITACLYDIESSCTNGTCETKQDGGCFKAPPGVDAFKAFSLECKNFGDDFLGLFYSSEDCSGPSFFDFNGSTFACSTAQGLFRYRVNCTSTNIPTKTPSPTPTLSAAPSPTPTPTSTVSPSPSPSVTYLTQLDVYNNSNCANAPEESAESSSGVCFPISSETFSGAVRIACASTTQFVYRAYNSTSCASGTGIGEPSNSVAGTCSNISVEGIGGAVQVTCSVFVNVSSSASPSPSKAPDSDPCFPADGVLSLENGLQKRMDELEIGDRVQVGVNKYSDVYFFGHKLARGTYDFVQLVLENGRKLELSKSHLVWATKKWKRGEDVKLGDLLLDVVENRMVPVASIQMVKKSGLFNPHTLQGDLVVNGV
eukprot:CAMPEP_0184707444 /NCGR_PEP_ID=MMETSP0313-20130426/37272_1 /TAXON_ID=2792 /ORGANISM="Porphyridium aerugineum, Strain SAG 1380-2" /LENGTH=505 /DNA_ID=CAMNT_0027169019 /DNA_START=523 /DNA_END=2036 /DNA_ORIENTATION=-